VFDISLRLAGKIAASNFSRLSFSQCGEDMIVDFIFHAVGVKKPSYLDIGAHHPKQFSNTFYFYLKGCKGVSVEPDPSLHAALDYARPRDNNLKFGVASVEHFGRPFFVMSTPTLNTFSEIEAKRYEATGKHHIARVENVPVVTVERIFHDYFDGQVPDFMSVDVEGLDYEIISSIDFNLYRPLVICVETLTFSENRTETKLTEIAEFLAKFGYREYADTYVNTIFVDWKRWGART
jgi:FkbM family methyltransferase